MFPNESVKSVRNKNAQPQSFSESDNTVQRLLSFLFVFPHQHFTCRFLHKVKCISVAAGKWDWDLVEAQQSTIPKCGSLVYFRCVFLHLKHKAEKQIDILGGWPRIVYRTVNVLVSTHLRQGLFDSELLDIFFFTKNSVDLNQNPK